MLLSQRMLFSQLPPSLVYLLLATLTTAQTTPTQIASNTIQSFNATSSLLFNIPSSSLSASLSINLALCSNANDSANIPRLFVSNSSSFSSPGLNDVDGTNVFEITFEDGFGGFEGLFVNGGLLRLEVPSGTQSIPLQLGISDEGPLLQPLDDDPESLPILGDTTANQVILFSPPFSPPLRNEPSYPNYTLPSADTAFPKELFPEPDSNTHTNYTIFVAETSDDTATRQPTACSLPQQVFSGKVVDERLWLKDMQGWRTQWSINGLNPATNYTAWVVKDNARPSKPIFFTTKSASFSCSLVTSLPYCPSISYSVALPPPPANALSYTSDNLPNPITSPLLESLTNFTTTLTTQACGRDLYSPLVTCADCQAAYRRWLCTVWFSRCSERRPGDNSSSISDASSAVSMVPAIGNSGTQTVLSALISHPTNLPPRNPVFPASNTPYTLLQPCIESCTSVDRACPSFLGFRCPLRMFGGGRSYAFGYEDWVDTHGKINGVGGGSVDGRGSAREGEGIVGKGGTSDKWGNVWCNRG